MSLHYYTRSATGRPRTTATGFEEGDWFRLLQRALLMDELITRHSTIMDRYDPDNRVALIVDEWGTWHEPEPGTNPRFLYQQSTMRDALVAAVTLDIFNRHCARVRGAQIAQTVNVLQAMALTEGDRMVLTPTYHVFDLYQGHQEATSLPLDVRADRDGIGDEPIPAVSASASRDAAGGVLLTMSNLDPNQSHEVSAEIRGAGRSDANRPGVNGRILTADTMQAHNTFDDPHAVRIAPFDDARYAGGVLCAPLPAMSVVALEIR